MPIYEYEHLFDECELCDFRFGIIQGVDDDDLEFCPSCGLEIRRVVSQFGLVKSQNFDADKAAKKGFTTWRKTEIGKWEKIGGDGVDMIVGSPEDISAVEEEKSATPQLNLDGD